MNQPHPQVVGVIPARFASSRFPGKVMARIAGKTMIQRVYEQAKKSKLLDKLFVAADDTRIIGHVQSFGGLAVMTSIHHKSGTDRIAEAVEKIPADIVVNIQGDQPLLDPLMIDEAIQPLLDDSTIPMSTIKTRITRADDLNNPNIVKVVVDKFDFALYFSRSLVPFPRDNKDRIEAFEHLGLYVYRKDFLLEYAKMSPGYLEQIEMLEQLRVLEMGYKIKVIETKSQSFAKGGFSVDTPEDRERVEKYILEHSLD